MGNVHFGRNRKPFSCPVQLRGHRADVAVVRQERAQVQRP